jgi:hypothetical protein
MMPLPTLADAWACIHNVNSHAGSFIRCRLGRQRLVAGVDARRGAE